MTAPRPRSSDVDGHEVKSAASKPEDEDAARRRSAEFTPSLVCLAFFVFFSTRAPWWEKELCELCF